MPQPSTTASHDLLRKCLPVPSLPSPPSRRPPSLLSFLPFPATASSWKRRRWCFSPAAPLMHGATHEFVPGNHDHPSALSSGCHAHPFCLNPLYQSIMKRKASSVCRLTPPPPHQFNQATSVLLRASTAHHIKFALRIVIATFPRLLSAPYRISHHLLSSIYFLQT